MLVNTTPSFPMVMTLGETSSQQPPSARPAEMVLTTRPLPKLSQAFLRRALKASIMVSPLLYILTSYVNKLFVEQVSLPMASLQF